MVSLCGVTMVGLGDPVTDVLLHVNHAQLSALGIVEPGGCLPVSSCDMQALLDHPECQGSPRISVPGGTCGNVMRGVASIAGGSGCCKFIGMVGKDDRGAQYRRGLEQHHVEPLLLESTSDRPSAVSLCLVTPDGQRTMRTCLGASLELQSAAQLGNVRWADGCRLLHCGGYCLYRPQLAREMMTLAKAGGALVSIDLASFELVRNRHDVFKALLEESLLDFVFANEEEAAALCQVCHLHQKDDAASTSQKVSLAQQYLLRYCRVAVVSLGARGCVAQAADGERCHASAPTVQVADTIGAGDFFTAGFLCAYLAGGSLQQCCSSGCASGSEAVQATGAQLGVEAIKRLQKAIAGILLEGAGQGGGGADSEAAPAVVGLLPLAEPVLA